NCQQKVGLSHEQALGYIYGQYQNQHRGQQHLDEKYGQGTADSVRKQASGHTDQEIAHQYPVSHQADGVSDEGSAGKLIRFLEKPGEDPPFPGSQLALQRDLKPVCRHKYQLHTRKQTQEQEGDNNASQILVFHQLFVFRFAFPPGLPLCVFGLPLFVFNMFYLPVSKPKQKGNGKHEHRIGNQNSLGKRKMCPHNHQCRRQRQQNHVFYTHPIPYNISSITPETLSNLYSLNPSSATIPVPLISLFGSSTVTNFSV